MNAPTSTVLAGFEAAAAGFRFRHRGTWLVTMLLGQAEQLELLSESLGQWAPDEAASVSHAARMHLPVIEALPTRRRGNAIGEGDYRLVVAWAMTLGPRPTWPAIDGVLADTVTCMEASRILAGVVRAQAGLSPALWPAADLVAALESALGRAERHVRELAEAASGQAASSV